MSGKMFDNRDYPTEWALNPSTYQGMDNDQVDWAALAQEWIKMKESSIPSAPTPPSISQSSANSMYGGGGEAPMDMEFKDDGIPPAPPAPNISGATNWNQRWNQQWDNSQASMGLGSANWDWQNSVSSETSGALPPRIPINLMIPPPAPVISSTPAFVDHAALGSSVAPAPPPFAYNARPHFNNQVPTSGFYNSEHPHPSGPIGFSKDLRPGVVARNPSSSAVPSACPALDMMLSRNRDVKEKSPETDSLSAIDTIKRKQLPAWIREGLEKMEREKQKAMERERQADLCKQELEARKKSKDEARAVLNPQQSKFDSDSEKELPDYESRDPADANSQEDVEKLQRASYDQASPDASRPRKTRFRDASSPEKLSNSVKAPKADLVSPAAPASPATRLSKEELLQNLMLQVRRSLTEILLEVTNDEITSICEEVWKNLQNKGKTSATISGGAAPVAQITRRLGLGIYSDSDSESGDEQLVQSQSEKSMTSRNDSDDELKETLRLRQQAFKRTEAEIEASLAEEDETSTKGEENQLARRTTTTSSDKNTRDRNKDRHKMGHTAQESNRHWKEDCDRDNSTAGDGKASFYSDDEKALSEQVVSKSRSTLDQEEDSRSSGSGQQQSSLSKRKPSHGSNNGKSNTSPRRKDARSSEKRKRYSSSRSRSRSRHDSSSRDDSSESSKVGANSTASNDGGRTGKRGEYKSERYKHSRSESRSRSRSRSRSSSSRSTARSKRKRSRSRSCSSHRKQHGRRNSHHSRSRHRSRSVSRSVSRSRSKSRSRRRSKSFYSSKSSGRKSERSKRRSSRSRSSERTRRSRSSSRKSKSSHRSHGGHRYERDRKKSSRHHMD